MADDKKIPSGSFSKYEPAHTSPRAGEPSHAGLRVLPTTKLFGAPQDSDLTAFLISPAGKPNRTDSLSPTPSPAQLSPRVPHCSSAPSVASPAALPALESPTPKRLAPPPRTALHLLALLLALASIFTVVPLSFSIVYPLLGAYPGRAGDSRETAAASSAQRQGGGRKYGRSGGSNDAARFNISGPGSVIGLRSVTTTTPGTSGSVTAPGNVIVLRDVITSGTLTVTAPGNVTVSKNVTTSGTPSNVTVSRNVTTSGAPVTAPGNVTASSNVTTPDNVTVSENVTTSGTLSNVTTPGNVTTSRNVTISESVTTPGIVTAPGTMTAPGNLTTLDDPLVIQRLNVSHPVEWETEWLPVSRQNYFHPDRKYLFVTGNGDMCTGISHTRTSLECRFKEARYLNRTLVLDMRMCLNRVHNNGTAVYKGIHHHFDLSSIRVPFTPLQGFLEEALAWQRARGGRDGDRGSGEGSVAVRVVGENDAAEKMALDKVTPLIIRANYYGFGTCNRAPLNRDGGDISFRPELVALAGNISRSMNGGDYAAVHVRRGDKLDSRRWPHLDNDTRPEALLETLPRLVTPGRTLYIATNERTPGFFDPLRRLYDVRMWGDFKHLWTPGTVWYDEYAKMMGPAPSLDVYMEVIVEYTLIRAAKRRLETFNDLTRDRAG